MIPPMSILRMVCFIGVAGSVLAASPADSWYRGATRCPVLDLRRDPVYTLDLGIVLPADVENGEAFSLMELDMHTDLLYFREVFLGDLDIRLHFQSVIPLNGGDLKLPDQLLTVAVDNRWTWRYVNDTAFQWRFEPGFYSALDSLSFESLSLPMTFMGIKTIDSSLSALAGVRLRLGFERVFMPEAGVVWQPAPEFRLEALVPESRAVYYVMPGWAVHARWAWESMTYQLPDDPYDRKRVTFEFRRLALGLTREINPEFRVGGEFGLLSGREIEFGRGGTSDVDQAVYLQAGIGGAF
jgi:hypothetical protein